jgi:hypothetical protein
MLRAMTIIHLPGARPAQAELDLLRAKLCELLWRLSEDVQAQAGAVLQSGDAPAFAAAVRETARKITEASAEWLALSETIQGSWRI